MSAPRSPTGHARFNQVAGVRRTLDGQDVPVGNLHIGIDHPALHLFAAQALDRYANTALAWADVRASDGEFGTWVCGAVRSGLTGPQLEAARASGISGEWREVDGHLELITALSVNSGGFPIQRWPWAMAASGAAATGRVGVRVRTEAGRVVAMCGPNMVHKTVAASAGCGCGTKPVSASTDSGEGLRLLRVIESRTRPLIVAAAALQRARIE